MTLFASLKSDSHRLTVKTLDQVFIMRVKEGLGCSQFEAAALTDLIKEVYFPWLSRPEAIQAGQLFLTAVAADEPGTKPLYAQGAAVGAIWRFFRHAVRYGPFTNVSGPTQPALSPTCSVSLTRMGL